MTNLISYEQARALRRGDIYPDGSGAIVTAKERHTHTHPDIPARYAFVVEERDGRIRARHSLNEDGS